MSSPGNQELIKRGKPFLNWLNNIRNVVFSAEQQRSKKIPLAIIFFQADQKLFKVMRLLSNVGTESVVSKQ